MGVKRIFKTRTFGRWSKKIIADPVLWVAAREVEAGQYEADLGAGLCKKRVPAPGRGKRGSVRTLVARNSPIAIIFLAGREKSDAGSDFTRLEVDAAKVVAKSFGSMGQADLDELKLSGALTEICNDKSDDED